MTKKIMLFLKIIICISVLSAITAPCGAETAFEKIRKAYTGIRDIEGKFIQKSRLKDLNRTDTFNGVFLIKIPGRMRWEYIGENSADEVIINSDEMIIYQKREKQAFKTRYDRAVYGRSPLAILSSIGEIPKEFDIVRNDEKLLLRPRVPMNGIVSVEIILASGNFPIGSIIITDKRSNIIELTLKDISINSGIRDAAFEFSLPKGVNMYDAEPQ